MNSLFVSFRVSSPSRNGLTVAPRFQACWISRNMSLLLAQPAKQDYVPKYLFLSADGTRETCKSRHVMKECKSPKYLYPTWQLLIRLCVPVLRKRDSIRRQKQSTARAQSRVLPWLRREDMQQSIDYVGDNCVETLSGSPSPPSCETNSRATTPQHSQWTSDSSIADSYECSSTSPSTLSTSHAPQINPQGSHRGLIDYSKAHTWSQT
jgi:hypothetical protein